MNTIRTQINVFRFIPWIKVVAITGGPGGGKSTFLKMAIRLLQKHGIKVLVVPEVARELISAGIVPWDPMWKGPLGFQKHVFLSILHKEALYFECLEDMNLDGKPVVFLCDRGLIDGMAYSGENDFKAMLYGFDLQFAEVLDRYDAVIHLVTAANGAEKFYVNDDERHETIEEACTLDQKTLDAWKEHQHLSVVDNSTDFPNKINKALVALQRTLAIPIPLEIEMKFLVKNFELDQIPSGSKSYKIIQTYLDPPQKPGLVCRVREKITGGSSSESSSFYYTEKTPTEILGVRGEFEEQITKEHAVELIGMYAHPACTPIEKTRYKIQYNQYILELDVYHSFLCGLVTLEVELPEVKAMKSFIPPYWFELTDVTSDDSYSNRSLAEFGIPKVAPSKNEVTK